MSHTFASIHAWYSYSESTIILSSEIDLTNEQSWAVLDVEETRFMKVCAHRVIERTVERSETVLGVVTVKGASRMLKRLLDPFGVTEGALVVAN